MNRISYNKFTFLAILNCLLAEIAIAIMLFLSGKILFGVLLSLNIYFNVMTLRLTKSINAIELTINKKGIENED